MSLKNAFQKLKVMETIVIRIQLSLGVFIRWQLFFEMCIIIKLAYNMKMLALKFNAIYFNCALCERYSLNKAYDFILFDSSNFLLIIILLDNSGKCCHWIMPSKTHKLMETVVLRIQLHLGIFHPIPFFYHLCIAPGGMRAHLNVLQIHN